ncbi:MAG: 2-amino-4-hydroxy-6-hydroxymethyldihydropteridine diphosphokinase [Cyclobacteriaceae bacterium]|nr:MAG: 2-amino-4-hydroxy-6-hydroxymethyldihydropteridine diphosphokinase [Cyclobacteriaceae bacterium]
MANVFLLLGSNLGDKIGQLTEARQQISRLIGPIVTASSIYKTAAWGEENQDDFLNQVVWVDTESQPYEVLNITQHIEKQAGRIRKERWGARTLDIDILLWDDKVVANPDLKIPHPGIPDRKFTLVPLAEIAPLLVHPILQKTIEKLLEDCTDNLPVERLQHQDS